MDKSIGDIPRNKTICDVLELFWSSILRSDDALYDRRATPKDDSLSKLEVKTIAVVPLPAYPSKIGPSELILPFSIWTFLR